MASDVGIREVYDLVERMRLETKSDIQIVRGELTGLRNDFMDMEKGRLTRLEQSHAELKGKFVAYVAIMGIIISIVVTALAKNL